ncbi:hypothetical protein K466DRAFT_105655 [Polyporus arcularius HHB13444]|uniref:Uncharacterized protein n=1 Tax=Polyporus arcularius HHB13444 TaxID=1314778 RepID=A0A5C3PG24_9APHY|nr:hypothetical protein K466DRAFT_105655 [Polyporus arcularius HHB13444]
MPRDTTESERCKALSADGRTPCRIILPKGERHKGRRFCPAHYEEYKQATAAYKKVSARTEKQKHTSVFLGEQLTVGTLRTTALVDSAVLVVEAWQSAITEEIQLREDQHKRFFPHDEDEGHRMWLHGLAADRIKAKDLLLLLLNLRRQILLAEHASSRLPIRAPAAAPAAIPAPSPIVPARPMVPAVTSEARQQRVRLLQPPSLHPPAHYDACNHGRGAIVDVERQQLPGSDEGVTCADVCLSGVCLVVFLLLVCLLWQAIAQWNGV